MNIDGKAACVRGPLCGAFEGVRAAKTPIARLRNRTQTRPRGADIAQSHTF